jgi:translation initiation factor IF-2
MAEYRLSQVARKLNVGRNTILDFLTEKGFTVDANPNSKINQEQYDMLARQFADSAHDKEEAQELVIGGKTDDMIIKADKVVADEKDDEDRVLIKDNAAPKKEEPEKISARTKLDGPKVVGKIDLNKKKEAPVKQEEPKVVEPEPKVEPKIEEKKEVPVEKVEEKKEVPVEKVEEKKPALVVEVPKQEEKKLEEPVKAEEKKPEPVAEPPKVEEKKPENHVIKAKADSLRGLKVLDKIELPKDRPKPVASSDQNQDRKKRPRKRIPPTGGGGGAAAPQRSGGGSTGNFQKRGEPRGGDRGRSSTGRKTEELTDKEIQDKIKATLAKLSGGGGGGGKAGTQRSSKYRKDKRSAKAEAEEERQIQEEEAAKVLHVTEFISSSDLSSLMDVSVNDVISACLSLGLFVSINQRLDAETITVIADEFGFEVDFTEAKEETDIAEVEDDESTLEDRAPIVTIMGHVDHGKTSLLDYIRKAKVTEGEAGGITQHIGAYDVITDSGKRVAFLDTPGHEAFTAMRARGAKITDVAIIVIAADDSVMPQTKEAINHAQVAGVPIVIAINKVDKPNANPDKIKEDLSQMNILVEEWGGKYQCQHVSAKTGEGIDDLLDKVLLEAELLELKANPNKPALGSVVEASLDKGRGFVSTIMVQAGTLRVGDVLLAGPHFGKVKAMFDHRGQKLDKAGPSTPVLMLGLAGAPQAGDRFNVMESDREARDVANKREQILREQSIRTKKHITLDEIGRRLAIGSFKELNVIVKGDVDGSIEALADSLLKLSTEEVQVNILHKAVGPISESDVLLASASDAVIVGFQVRPSGGARKLAEQEEIEIRLYSIIYDAINDVKDAMEGMLEPTSEEVITGNIEVREVYKITKVGTVAGCYVTEGNVKRSNKVRLVRDGIVVYTGEINQLKRFKDDVAEVKNGYECGLSIKNFNDIKVGDIVEGFELKEVKRTL